MAKYVMSLYFLSGRQSLMDGADCNGYVYDDPAPRQRSVILKSNGAVRRKEPDLPHVEYCTCILKLFC